MNAGRPSGNTRNADRRVLAEFTIPSEPGNERRAMKEVAEVLEGIGFSEKKLERLKTAVAETMMNAMEHGNKYDPGKPAFVEIEATDTDVFINITDEGEGPPETGREDPDIAAKLDGAQTPRGWGLFLIKNMADEMNVSGDESHHTVELVFHIDGQEGGA